MFEGLNPRPPLGVRPLRSVSQAQDVLVQAILAEAAEAYGREESEAAFIDSVAARVRDRVQTTENEVRAAVEQLRGPPPADAWPWGTPTHLARR
jgi:hypothetical protein